jgi:hypothetical protein
VEPVAANPFSFPIRIRTFRASIPSSRRSPIIPLELEAAEIPDELQYILAPFQRHRLEGADKSKIIHNALAAL